MQDIKARIGGWISKGVNWLNEGIEGREGTRSRARMSFRSGLATPTGPLDIPQVQQTAGEVPEIHELDELIQDCMYSDGPFLEDDLMTNLGGFDNP